MRITCPHACEMKSLPSLYGLMRKIAREEGKVGNAIYLAFTTDNEEILLSARDRLSISTMWKT